MKELIGYHKDLGESGGKVSGVVGVSADHFKLELSAEYPIEKLIEPATKAADSLIDKLEAVIPGDQKAFFGKLKAEYKEELIKFLSEKPGDLQVAAAPEAEAPQAGSSEQPA